MARGPSRLSSECRAELWVTYGPSVDREETLRALIEAGAEGFRLTFSYGTPELQCERAARVKAAAAALDREVRVIADLPGEKCRIAKAGDVEGVEVRAGEVVELAASGDAHLGRKPRLLLQKADHTKLFAVDDVVIEGDGALLMDVIEVSAVAVSCVPRSDGVLRPGRGLAIQGSSFVPKSMTRSDRESLEVLLGSADFDGLALSFVSEAAVVAEARSLIAGKRGLEVIAKVETAEGMRQLTEITEAADSVMAARGDLALSMAWTMLADEVGEIARTARRARKPWQLATQIAESMERSAMLSRAEICDLSHWLEEGAAAVMLSRETAFGKRPVEAVAAVAALIDARWRLAAK